MNAYHVTLEMYESACQDMQGICTACHELVDGVEPDAEGYTCPACDEAKVFGMEQALIMGLIEVED